MFAFDHLLHLNVFLFNDENVNLPSKKNIDIFFNKRIITNKLFNFPSMNVHFVC